MEKRTFGRENVLDMLWLCKTVIVLCDRFVCCYMCVACKRSVKQTDIRVLCMEQFNLFLHCEMLLPVEDDFIFFLSLFWVCCEKNIKKVLNWNISIHRSSFRCSRYQTPNKLLNGLLLEQTTSHQIRFKLKEQNHPRRRTCPSEEGRYQGFFIN